ncbi:MAG: hypothetical protein IJD59_06220 [Clostridia bacterium]|nr:hypothetical protein [Clostridia bacterium]
MDKIYIGLYHLFGGLSIFEQLFSVVFEGVRKIPYSHADRMGVIRSMIVYGRTFLQKYAKQFSFGKGKRRAFSLVCTPWLAKESKKHQKEANKPWRLDRLNAPSIIPFDLFLIPRVQIPGSSDCSHTQNQEVQKYRFSELADSI